MRHGNAFELEVNPGEAVYIAGGSWIINASQIEYASLGIVFHTGFTRYLHTHWSPDQPQVRSIRPSSWHHGPAISERTGKQLCGVLDHADSVEPEDVYIVRVFEALLMASSRLLRLEARDAAAQIPPGGKAFVTWQAASRYVVEHCDQPITRDDVADSLGVHPNHVSRLFTHFSAESFSSFVHRTRMQRARELLRDPQLNISEIAALCGFTDANYFSRMFRRHFGLPPTRFRPGMS